MLFRTKFRLPLSDNLGINFSASIDQLVLVNTNETVPLLINEIMINQ